MKAKTFHFQILWVEITQSLLSEGEEYSEIETYCSWTYYNIRTNLDDILRDSKNNKYMLTT